MRNQPVAIVTGASRGMGAWIARWLSAGKAAVVVTARSKDALDRLADEIGGNGGGCVPIAADVSDPGECFRVVDETLDRFGGIDALVNNAGVLGPIARAAECDVGQFRENIEINLLGPFYMIRRAAGALRKSRGRIVNVSSGAAVNPMASWGAYSAAKAGLTHFTKVLALEEPGITSVAVRPGVVDTDMQALIREKGAESMPAKMHEYFVGLKQQGNLVPPSVPARSIAWLALKAPAELSGKFVEYDDPRIVEAAGAFFEAAPEIR